MKVKSEKLLESYALKNMVLEYLKGKSLTFTELKEQCNLSKQEVTTFINSFKKYGFIKYDERDLNLEKGYKRYVIIEGMPRYEVFIAELRANATKARKEWHDKKLEYSPYANPDMCITSNSYPTTGNKHKLSAWHGYSSIGGL